VKKGLNKETLKKLYIKEEKTTVEIAKMFASSPNTIQNKCREYGIKLRPGGTIIKGLNKSVLQKLYVNESKSIKEIAEMLSCSYSTIRQNCNKYSIELRGHKNIKGLTKVLLKKLYIKEGKTTREIAQIIGCSREIIRRSCKQYGIPLRNPGSKEYDIDELTLRRLYIKEGKRLTEIAKMFGCSVSVISRKIKRFG
jgi:transposase